MNFKVLSIIWIIFLTSCNDNKISIEDSKIEGEALKESSLGNPSKEEDTASNEEDTASQDEDTASNEEDVASKEEDTASKEEDTTSQDEANSDIECKNLDPNQKRAYFKNPHVEDLSQCKKEIQHQICVDHKILWSGSFRYPSCSTLPFVSIKMEKEVQEKFENTRKEVIDSRVPRLPTSSKIKFPATVYFNGVAHEAKIRLKGGQRDHILPKKFSIRINLTDSKDLIFGVSKFNLEEIDRNGFTEAFIQRQMKEENILAPQRRYVLYELNDEFLGIMTFEEIFSKEVLPLSNKEDGPILQPDPTPVDQVAKLGENPSWWFRSFEDGYHFNYTRVPFEDEHFFESTELLFTRNEALGIWRGIANQKIVPSKAFDGKMFGTYGAILGIWNSFHGLFHFNRFFYYNPMSKKFEPVSQDNNGLDAGAGSATTTVIYPTEEYFQSYEESLKKISDSLDSGDFLKKIQKDIVELCGESLGVQPCKSYWSVNTAAGFLIPKLKSYVPKRMIQFENAYEAWKISDHSAFVSKWWKYNLSYKPQPPYSFFLSVYAYEENTIPIFEFVNITPSIVFIKDIYIETEDKKYELIQTGNWIANPGTNPNDAVKIEAPVQCLEFNNKCFVAARYEETEDWTMQEVLLYVPAAEHMPEPLIP